MIVDLGVDTADELCPESGPSSLPFATNHSRAQKVASIRLECNEARSRPAGVDVSIEDQSYSRHSELRFVRPYIAPGFDPVVVVDHALQVGLPGCLKNSTSGDAILRARDHRTVGGWRKTDGRSHGVI